MNFCYLFCQKQTKNRWRSITSVWIRKKSMFFFTNRKKLHTFCYASTRKRYIAYSTFHWKQFAIFIWRRMGFFSFSFHCFVVRCCSILILNNQIEKSPTKIKNIFSSCLIKFAAGVCEFLFCFLLVWPLPTRKF